MQKIMILGASSLGIAAQLSSLASERDLPLVFIPCGEPDLVIHQYVDEPDYRAPSLTHSFELTYNPTPKEVEWMGKFGDIRVDYEGLSSPNNLSFKEVPSGSFSVTCYSAPAFHSPMLTGFRSQFTKSQPSKKMRRAARRRAKAGRKAAR